MIGILSAADSRVSASLLRQFFDRVKNFDEQILAQMVRFYLMPARRERPERGSSGQARLPGHQALGGDRPGERALRAARSDAARASCSRGSGADARRSTVDPATLASPRAERSRSSGASSPCSASFEALTGSGFVQRYRELKHELGRYLFHPELLIGVVETNLAVKNKVRQYYRVRGAAHPRRVAPDPRAREVRSAPMPRWQRSSPSSARRWSSSSASQQRDNVKLDDLDLLRRQVERACTAAGRASGRTAAEPAGGGGGRGRVADGVRAARDGRRSRREPVRREIAALPRDRRSARFDRQPGSSPKTVALSRDIYHLRLEPREIVAYRRSTSRPRATPRSSTSCSRRRRCGCGSTRRPPRSPSSSTRRRSPRTRRSSSARA